MRTRTTVRSAVRHVLRRAASSAAVLSYATLAVVLPAHAVELPIACIGGSCGADPSGAIRSFISSGAATAVRSGNTLNVTQTSDNAVLNWRSFNISADGTVNFIQPDASSIALNRIFDTEVSKIYGALNANGRIYLLNQNGVLFGQGAKVNVGSLIASSLEMTPDALDNGIYNGILSPSVRGNPAFERAKDESDNPLPAGAITVEAGAELKTTEGGQVFLFAPEVINRGRIVTPEGQTILAAGDSVYLLASGDPNLRGILVEVGVGEGRVVNGEEANATRDVASTVGEIVAERGNVTLAALAVEQRGRISATTSVRQNGTVRLQARNGGSINSPNTSGASLVANNGGELTLGERSAIDIGLDVSDGSSVDANAQLASRVMLDGRRVNVLSGSRINAPGGEVSVTASVGERIVDPLAPPTGVLGDEPTDARIYIAPDATIDVSGASSEVAMERNSMRVELRGNQLRDSPEQRDGPLRGLPAYVDIRASGVRGDGTTWIGTSLADVSGDIATIQRDVYERNSLGGSVRIASQGDVIIAPESSIDVSGGEVRYRDGFVLTSQLLGADGRVYDIATADPNREYIGTADRYVVRDQRWGVERSYSAFVGTQGRAEAGYVEGKDAGAISVIAPRTILDGDMVAGVTIGRNQRHASEALAASTRFRPYDQLPLGGRLSLGNFNEVGEDVPDFEIGNVRFAPGFVLPNLQTEEGELFDPLEDAWIDEADELRIRPELLGGSGMSHLELYANGTVTVPADMPLELPLGGSWEVTARAIDIGADIRAPGGLISGTARRTLDIDEEMIDQHPNLLVRSGVTLDARGAWVNDNPLLNPQGAHAPLLIDGGEVSLHANSSGALTLEPGSVIDVTGGAWRNKSGSVRAGTGGSIDLGVAPDEANLTPSELVLGAELRAFSLQDGGSLTLSANAICISDLDCEEGEDGALVLSSAFFQQGGFGKYDLTANLGSMLVTGGTTVQPRQLNLEINRDTSSIATGTSIEDFSRAVLLSDFDRRPTGLSLSQHYESIEQVPAAEFFDLPTLTVADGALIVADPLAAISLQSNVRMLVDGTLRAQGGSVDLHLTNDINTTDFLPGQGIWLGANGHLDVSGTSILRPDELGRIGGSVLDGGSVSLRADNGYVISLPGSNIDVSGTTAEIDVQTPSGLYTPRSVATNGGALNIFAAEGAVLNNDFTAHGGTSAAAGGAFSLELSRANRYAGVDPQIRAQLPISGLTITLARDVRQVVLGAGNAVPDALNGRAVIDVASLERSGAEFVSMTAQNTKVIDAQSGSETAGPRGSILFGEDLDWSVAGRLRLAAPIIDIGSATSTLDAVYVSFENAQVAQSWDQDPVADLTRGSGALTVRADHIDVLGAVAFDNNERLRLESSGDLRLRGVAQLNEARFTGSLTAAGDIDLHAQQIYPATLTDFRIASADSDLGRIRTIGGGATTPLLSAAGHVTLAAPRIEHGGTLRAPFGTIELDATDELILLPNSLISTRADTVIPFGATQGGFDWTYQLPGGSTTVFGSDAAVPEQQVLMSSAVIDFQEGARIDVSAGGDLQASEWVPGVGGSRDVLSAELRPNQFAILPASQLAFAPHDTAMYEDSTLLPGDSIYLAGGGGIEAGLYALLPARYALLPGAYLVTAVDGYQDVGANETYSRLDGSTIVGGYRTVAGVQRPDARLSGFAIRPGSAARAEAQYDLTLASKFFRARALELDTPVPRLAGDAGRISFTAGQELMLNGELLAAADEDGRGVALDLSSARMRIVNESSESQEGFVDVDAAELASLGAESILIGGRRRSTAEGTEIAVSAEIVEVAEGVSVSAPELLFTARDTVTVERDATVSAQGTAAGDSERLLLSGDSALLRVSQAAQVEVQRDETTVGLSGTVDVDPNARLVANGGSITADSSLDTISLGTLELVEGSLGISASRISFGGDETTEGLVLAPDQFAGLGLNELALRSRSTIDFYGDVLLSADQDLVLAGLGLHAAALGANVQIHGERVTLLNTGVTELEAVAGDSTLSIAATELSLGQGAFSLSGFANAQLGATTDLVASDNGRLETAGGLTLAASRVIGEAGTAYAFEAAGPLTIRGATSPSNETPSEAPLGARLAFTAQSILHEGTIDAPSGIVEMTATGENGGVVIASGATIRANGRASVFDGVVVPARAGSISLTANDGDIRTASGSVLDVAAAADGSAGSLAFIAPQGSVEIAGTLNGQATSSVQSGEVSIDSRSIGALESLNTTLRDGGFFAQRSIRQRGPGDLTIAAGSKWQAHHLELTADQGGININGTIDGAGERGGIATLAARDTISVTGTIDLAASGAGERGGELALRSTQGGVLIEPSARIAVNAGATVGPEPPRAGTVHVRVTDDAAMSVLNDIATDDALRIAGRVDGAGRLTIEGYEAYLDADGLIDGAQVLADVTNPMYAHAEGFVANAPSILTALGLNNNAAARVVPGIEIYNEQSLTSDGALTLTSDWNLYNWRFAGAPGVLTLRAAGNLTFDRSLSDGFTSPTSFTLPTQASDSWSYRLVAGADLTSADTLAVLPRSTITQGSGNFVVNAGREGNPAVLPTLTASFAQFRMIRTGNGDIAIAAANDFSLGNNASVIYTAGVAGPGIALPRQPVPAQGGIGGLAYPINGGDVSITAGGNATGAVSNQLATAWLWRTGPTTGLGEQNPTGWSVRFDRFEQGIGALGGGNVVIEATGNVTNLSASIPSIGRQIGGTTPEQNAIDIVGGGTLNVSAGGKLAGGNYFVGSGELTLRAGDDVTRDDTSITPSLAPLLAVGDTDISIAARSGVAIDGIANYTLISQGRYQNVGTTKTFFSTYTPDASASLATAAGDISLFEAHTSNIDAVLASLANPSDFELSTFRLAPPTLRATSFSGDVSVVNAFTLFPASEGNLELFGDQNVRFAPSPLSFADTGIRMPEVDPELVPSPLNPNRDYQAGVGSIVSSLFDTTRSASELLHAPQSGLEVEVQPVRIVAQTGDVVFAEDASSFVEVSKPARIVAGRDVLNPNILTQNVQATDATSIIAGRDIRYDLSRIENGSIAQNTRQITVAGPGLLEVRAGRNIDLQASAGITTDGNRRNPALPEGGANISLIAGVGGSNAQNNEDFITRYLELGTGYDTDLIAYIEARTGEQDVTQEEADQRFKDLAGYRAKLVSYVEARSGKDDLTEEQALAMFRAYSQTEQQRLIEQVFYGELRASGRLAAPADSPRNKDFSRGFTAVETLFPGANPDLDANEVNPYSGDINLYFSRVYTTANGDISLFAPGGAINAGLASPPEAFGVNKAPSQLGIVAQQRGNVNAFAFGDFAVNESRVFSADGDDILVWSTRGDIDAGRGAKTAISAPAPSASIDRFGRVRTIVPPALTGSGIQALATSDGVKPGNVDLFAPRGVVNAGDAGIVAGNLTIAATAVLGADNIQVSGVSVGVPVDAGGLGASLAGVSAAASGAASAATASVEAGANPDEQPATLAETALSWLEVFVVGLGEDACRQDDVECLKRQD